MQSGLPAPDANAPDERFRALVEQLPAIVYIVSNEPRPETLYVSPQIEAMLGQPPIEWQRDAERWPSAIHDDDRERVLREWRTSVETGAEFHMEYRFLHADGRTVWVRDGVVPVRDAEGKILFWRGVAQDITEFRHAEEELRRSEARYRALVEGVPAVVYEMRPDDDRRTVYVSPHVERVLGYSRQEWLDQGDIWTELLHPDDRETELAAHDLHNETGEPWSREYRLIAEDGRFVWVRDQAVLVRDVDGTPRFWQGVMLDVTEQKELEEQLRRVNDELEFRVLARTAELAEANEMMQLEIGERKRAEEQSVQAEERYRNLVERMPAVAYVWEVGPIAARSVDQAYMSPQLESLLGFTPVEWYQHPGFWLERIHPHDRVRVLEASLHSGSTGDPFMEEYRYLAKDGRVVWVLDQANLLTRDRVGQPILFQGVMLDITARKDAETKAAEAEARYRMLAEQGPIVAYMWDMSPVGQEGPFTYISPQVEEMLGYPISEWREKPGAWRLILHPDDRPWLDTKTEEIERRGGSWSIEYRVIAADGRVVWLHDEGGLVSRDDEGKPKTFHGVLLDITDRKESEARLRESEGRYRALTEGLPGIPWTEVVDVATGRGRITYIGPQVLEVFGYAPDELIAEPDHFERMVHPDDRERVMARSAHVDETGEPWDEVFRVVARGGKIVWVYGRAVLVDDDDGRRVWHGITWDVTAEVERGMFVPPQLRAIDER